MEIRNEFNYLDKNEFVIFLNSIDNDFTPKLSVKIDFHHYYDKIKGTAKIISLFDNGELIGLLIYYDNLEQAQVTLVGVKEHYRGKRISYFMFERLFALVNKPIKIITWNENELAKKLYLNLGFEIIECSKNTYGIDEILMVKK